MVADVFFEAPLPAAPAALAALVPSRPPAAAPVGLITVTQPRLPLWDPTTGFLALGPPPASLLGPGASAPTSPTGLECIAGGALGLLAAMGARQALAPDERGVLGPELAGATLDGPWLQLDQDPARPPPGLTAWQAQTCLVQGGLPLPPSSMRVEVLGAAGRECSQDLAGWAARMGVPLAVPSGSASLPLESSSPEGLPATPADVLADLLMASPAALAPHRAGAAYALDQTGLAYARTLGAPTPQPPLPSPRPGGLRVLDVGWGDVQREAGGVAGSELDALVQALRAAGPAVVLHLWAQGTEGTWALPRGLAASGGQYTNETFLSALEDFVAALGARLDGEPSLAGVSAGLLGAGGFWLAPPTPPTPGRPATLRALLTQAPASPPDPASAPPVSTILRLSRAFQAAFPKSRLLAPVGSLGELVEYALNATAPNCSSPAPAPGCALNQSDLWAALAMGPGEAATLPQADLLGPQLADLLRTVAPWPLFAPSFDPWHRALLPPPIAPPGPARLWPALQLLLGDPAYTERLPPRELYTLLSPALAATPGCPTPQALAVDESLQATLSAAAGAVPDLIDAATGTVAVRPALARVVLWASCRSAARLGVANATAQADLPSDAPLGAPAAWTALVAALDLETRDPAESLRRTGRLLTDGLGALRVGLTLAAAGSPWPAGLPVNVSLVLAPGHAPGDPGPGALATLLDLWQADQPQGSPGFVARCLDATTGALRPSCPPGADAAASTVYLVPATPPLGGGAQWPRRLEWQLPRAVALAGAGLFAFDRDDAGPPRLGLALTTGPALDAALWAPLQPTAGAGAAGPLVSVPLNGTPSAGALWADFSAGAGRTFLHLGPPRGHLFSARVAALPAELEFRWSHQYAPAGPVPVNTLLLAAQGRLPTGADHDLAALLPAGPDLAVRVRVPATGQWWLAAVPSCNLTAALGEVRLLQGDELCWPPCAPVGGRCLHQRRLAPAVESAVAGPQVVWLQCPQCHQEQPVDSFCACTAGYEGPRPPPPLPPAAGPLPLPSWRGH
ncbi:hypothetical protein PAPYR_13341 [Paratrimastix pyriformis]|uniref:Uncharacterized protein n=1 Tax=Paratrimastix pyriformis TaxID=342808 RepID=A0ABQ8U6S3_9EUKA|nr:hypothetical protein PAPYR_13341 [Paratrimastix pyriformis]